MPERGPLSTRSGSEPMPDYGIERDFPLLWAAAKLHDARERLAGGDREPLGAEIEAALHELWDARRYVSEGRPS